MKSFIKLYLEAYKGLSTPAWMLALVMLVNRSGAMVVPFLGVYMVNQLHFDLETTGIVLSCFGIGSVLGSSIGGWLTDKLGHFKVQFFSLLLTVPMFLILPQLKTEVSLAMGIFIMSMISDALRPANSVSIAYYSKPENVIRSFTLNRMALNLGFSIGPALGGFLAAISYNWLFYGNAVAALLSAAVFFLYFKNKKGTAHKEVKEETNTLHDRSPYRDVPFLVFSFLSIIYAICFFQLLNTVPLYYRTVYALTETQIGIILAYSGVVVFSLEMLIVHWAERKMAAIKAIVYGVIFCAMAFLSLLLTKGLWLLYLSMFMLCISEILAMPFMATVTLQRSNKTYRGAYMGLNSLSLSAGLIFAPFLGTKVAAKLGFDALWMGTGIVMLLTALGFVWLMKRMRIDKTKTT